MISPRRIANVIALTALVGVLTAPRIALAQSSEDDSHHASSSDSDSSDSDSDESSSDSDPSHHHHHRHHHHHHSSSSATPATPAAPPAEAATPPAATPVAPAHALVTAAPTTHETAAQPAATNETATHETVTPIETPAATSEHPSAPEAHVGTPLPVRQTRALNLAPAHASGDGWKLLAGAAGLAVGIFVWKRRAAEKDAASGPELKIVRRAPLQHHGELLVIEVGGQRMLIGATSTSVQHLATLEAGDERATDHALSSAEMLSLDPPTLPKDETAAHFEAMLVAARSARSAADRASGERSILERDTMRTAPHRPTLPRESPPTEDEVEEQVRGLISLGVPR